MNFEILKRSHLKRNIIIGVILIAIISAVILNFTKAKYRVTQSIPLVNGTINYSLADLNIIAITVDGESVDTIPDGNYELTEESYCTINGEKDSSISISYDSNTKTLNVIPFTTKGTKCYLDFVTVIPKKEVDTVLGTIEVNIDTPDFSKTAQADCSGIDDCEETNGIYEGQDDDGTTYYWRGAVDNNWVKFGGFYWRIIRINGDGTLRLIYQGTSANTMGTGTQIGYSAFNSSYDNNMYVGLKYTSGNVHGIETNSTILGVLNTWYQENLASYADDIDMNAGFCNDRQPSTSETSSNGSGGTGTTETYYGAYIRLYAGYSSSNASPSFKCSNSSDLFTVSSSNKGNQALQYPIGLITADEVAYAGGVWATTNKSYYLYTGQYYWTMSPFRFYSIYAWVIYVGSGTLFAFNGNSVDTSRGVRPVINLRSDVTISSGDGTATNPYVVS